MKFIKLLCKAHNLKMYYVKASYADTFIFTFINPLTNDFTCYHASVHDLQMLDYNTKKLRAEDSQYIRRENAYNSWHERQYLIERLETIA